MDLSPLKLEQKFDLYLINGCGEGCLIFYRKRNAGKESSRTWNKKEVQSFSPDFMKSGNALSVFCDLYNLLAAQDWNQFLIGGYF